MISSWRRGPDDELAEDWQSDQHMQGIISVRRGHPLPLKPAYHRASSIVALTILPALCYEKPGQGRRR